jgi:hypothetical protein
MRKLIFLTALIAVLFPYRSFACITPNHIDDAQQIMDELNAGRHAVLCTNTTWILNKSIVFPTSAHDLYIYTDTFPHDNTRATLSLQTSTTNCAVRANEGQPNVQLRNLIIDGSGGTCTTCDHPLVWFGGASASGQIVDSCLLKGAHGWTHLVFERGNDPGCTAAQVTNNEIGPMGGSYVPNGHTDGLSLQCANSTVFYNYIHDFNDGGIVVFGAPGSDIWGNDIRSSEAISGIAMVDQSWSIWDPATGQYDENFQGTTVHNNTITATGPGGLMGYGIAMGRRLLDCTGYAYGGSVTNNLTTQEYGAYGFIYCYAVDGVSSWTVTGNTNQAGNGGPFYYSCEGTPPGSGQFLVHNADVVSSTLQSDFVDWGPMHAPYR